ncbi:MAG: hypothetical protein MZU95_00210 [Desulfomicrobium escambiense]|nr:hypothetical protein [Desulfomicrobium escambiense]
MSEAYPEHTAIIYLGESLLLPPPAGAERAFRRRPGRTWVSARATG